MFARSMRQWWWRLIVSALVLLLVGGGYGGGDQADEGKETAATGQVKIVYEDDAIEPENRDAMEVIRKSGVLERLADWTNEVVALPHGMEVRVTDELPEGVEDMVTETHGVLAEFVEEVEARVVPPPCSPRRSSTPPTSTRWRTSTSSATRWATR